MKDKVERRKIFMRVLLWSAVGTITCAICHPLTSAYGIYLPFLPTLTQVGSSLVIGSMVAVFYSYVPFRRGKKDEEPKP